jgi:inward rectifier potassium channel
MKNDNINSEQKKEFSDLGFGRVVSEESQRRLINKDGSFNVTRQGLNFFTSLSVYHHLLEMPWWRFIGAASLGYFCMNLFFGFVYMLIGMQGLEGSQASSLLDELFQAFFFSVQTSSTIGYGHITPGSLSADLVVTIESFIGLLGFALVTGLVFARFSRPTAKILFSEKAVVGPYKEITAFMFRIVNARKNQIIELEAQLHFSCVEEKEGGKKRNFYQLPLERTRVPFFPLSWTIVHPIDEQSPLYGSTHEQLLKKDAEFMILLTGMDDTFNQTVFSRSSYKADEIVFGAKFTSIYQGHGDGHAIIIDIARLGDIEKVKM